MTQSASPRERRLYIDALHILCGIVISAGCVCAICRLSRGSPWSVGVALSDVDRGAWRRCPACLRYHWGACRGFGGDRVQIAR